MTSTARTTDRALRLPPIHRLTLPNGLTLLVLEDHRLPIAALELMWPRGAGSDPAGADGLTHFMVEMLRKGTRRRTASEIARSADDLPAFLEYATDHDSTTASVQSLREQLRPAVRLLRETVREPSFPPREVDRLRAELIGHRARDKEHPEFLADRALDVRLFGAHPYGRAPEGTATTLATITRDSLRARHRALFTPRGAWLAVVGDLTEREARTVAADAFADWSGADPEALPTQPRRNEPAGVLILDKPDATQVQIRLGHPSFRRGHPDFFPALVANYALGGGGFSSRLMAEVRSRRGLTYGVSSHFSARRLGGSFEISTFSRVSKATEAIAACLAEVRRMRAQGPTASEIREAVDYLAGSFPLRLETANSVAGLLLYAELHGLGDDYLATYRPSVRAVTRRTAAAAARAHLDPLHMDAVVLGPARELARPAARFGPVTVEPYDRDR